jgi:hypothetical protein
MEPTVGVETPVNGKVTSSLTSRADSAFLPSSVGQKKYPKM